VSPKLWKCSEPVTHFPFMPVFLRPACLIEADSILMCVVIDVFFWPLQFTTTGASRAPGWVLPADHFVDGTSQVARSAIRSL